VPTTFYFLVDTSAAVEPAFSGWQLTTGAVRRKMVITTSVDAITTGAIISGANSAGTTFLDRQYVSDPISFQVISGSANMQLMTREYAGTDNVDLLMIKAYVVDSAASARGTLLTLNSYAATAEFVNDGTHRNKTALDGDIMTAVTAQNGDRIVLEIGYRNSTSGTTPQASAKYGNNAANLPVNETQTTNGAGFFTISPDISFFNQQILSITQIGVPTLQRKGFFSFLVSQVGVVTLSNIFKAIRDFSITQLGVVTFTGASKFLQVLNNTMLGVVSFVKDLISGGPSTYSGCAYSHGVVPYSGVGREGVGGEGMTRTFT